MLVVVGGQSRKIGKSSVVAGLIGALRAARWTAVKVSPHFHAPAPPGGGYILTEEFTPGKGDSGRYLAAGAVRAFWLQADEQELAAALPALETIIATSANTIIESNSILNWLRPDLYLVVIDGSLAGWKSSGMAQLDKADAFIVVARDVSMNPHSASLPEKPRFVVEPPVYLSKALVEFVSSVL
jgi:hypothetical protein